MQGSKAGSHLASNLQLPHHAADGITSSARWTLLPHLQLACCTFHRSIVPSFHRHDPPLDPPPG